MGGSSEGKWTWNATADVIWVVAAVALAVEIACGFAYGWTQGTAEPFIGPITYQHVNSGLFVLFGIAAAVLAVGTMKLYHERSFGAAFGVGALCAVSAVLSLTSTVGFTGMEKAKVEANLSHGATSYKALAADVARLEKEIGWIPIGRPADLVSADISLRERDDAYVRTGGCSMEPGKITREDSKKFCLEYAALLAEKKSAETRAAANRDLLKAQERLRSAKPVSSGDMLAVQLHDFFGWNQDTTSRSAPTLRGLGIWLLALFGFPCSYAVRASGRVQAPSSPLPVLTVERPPSKLVELPSPVEPSPAETAPEAPTAPEPVKALSAPAKRKTAARQALDSPGQPSKTEPTAEEWVARWAWGLRPGVYTVADLRQSWGEFVQRTEKAGGAIPAVHKSKIGEALEALGYEKFRDPGNERKTSFRFPKDERIVANATSTRRS